MPVKGVRMSENRMTPSGLKARQGCSEISTCISLASEQHVECYSACTIALETSCADLSYRANRVHKGAVRMSIHVEQMKTAVCTDP